MEKRMRGVVKGLLITFLCLAFAAGSQAYDLNEKFSIGGIIAGAYQ